jgi:FkbM family methyltransferase
MIKKILYAIVERIVFSNTANKILKKKNKRIVEYPNGEHKKTIELLNRNNIDVVLDVGANTGQYGSYLRSIGYRGAIISFEPIQEAFEELKNKTIKDDLWNCYNIALGDVESIAEINITNNSQSSSFLNFSNHEVIKSSEIEVIKKQQISIKTLDQLFDDLISNYKNPFLKLDVQGYELKVLEGAKKSLSKLVGVQLEMSFEEVYEGEYLYNQMIEYLKQRNFYLCALKNGFHNIHTGQLIQADGIFYRIN